ncbi:MAG: amino acid racemase [Clostridia bacterium]|nr:amino acid racemase [Clostridia bacterium]
MASAYFYELITRHTKAASDQDHIDIILSSRASTPDRTDFILGRSDKSPLPAMIADAQSLEVYGATAIVIPCNTAHYFLEEVQKSVSVPMPSIITETALHIQKCGFRKAAILATEGTILSGSYQRELERLGLEWMTPDENGKAMLMDLIYGSVKRGVIPSPEELYRVSDPMFEAGCDCAILGCTELSLIGEQIDDERFVDSLLTLAACSIRLMGHETVELPASFS